LLASCFLFLRMKLSAAIALGAFAAVASANHHEGKSALRHQVDGKPDQDGIFWGCCANGGLGCYSANATVIYTDLDGTSTRSHGFVGVDVLNSRAGIWVGDLLAKNSKYGWAAFPDQHDPNVLLATAWGQHKCIHYRIWKDCLPRACFGFATHTAFPWTRDIVNPEDIAEFQQFQDYYRVHSVWVNSGSMTCMPYYMITEDRCVGGGECKSWTNPEALAERAKEGNWCRAWPLDIAMDVYEDEMREPESTPKPRPGKSHVRSVFLFQNGTSMAPPADLLTLPARCTHS